MSEAPNNPPATSSPAPTEPTKKTKKPGRWRRRAWYAFWIILALAIVLRLILIFAFPVVLRKVAAHYGFDCTYERTEIYLIDSDMGVWHLKITPKSGGDPLLDAEYCRADVSALNLLRGRLVVRRVEADGVEINVGRNEKGEFPALQSFLQSPHTAAATTQKTAATSNNQSLSLDSPLKIDALRLNHVRTRLRDRSVKPPTDATLETTIRLSDLGSDIRPTKFLMDLASNPFLDAMRIEGEGTSHGQSLQANFSLSIRGLHPKPAAGYLLPLGTRGDANDITVRANAKIEISPTTKPSQPTPTTQPIDLTADALISDVSIAADGVEAAGIDRIALDVPSFNQGAVHIAALVIDGVRAHALRTAAGNLRFAGMELAPLPPAAATQPAVAASSQPPMPLPKKWVIDLLALRHLNVGFRDESVTPAADLSLTSDDIHIKKIIADPAHPEAPVEIAGLLTSPGMARSITLSGSATPFAEKKAVQIKLLVEGIKPDAIKGYLDAAGLESQFKNGMLSCDLDASGAIADNGAVSADAHFGHIKLSDDKDLFAFDGVTINGVAVDPKATKIRAESIEISGPKMNVLRDPQGTLIALGFKTKPPTIAPVKPAPTPTPTAKTSAPAAPAAPAASPPILEIGKLAWKGIDIHFDDQAIAPANSFALNDAGLEMTDLHLDLAGKSAPPAPGKLRGWFSLPGVAGKLTVDGTIVPQTDAMSTDLTVTGKGLDATRLATYAKPFGIEPTLKDGSLQLHAQAKVGTTDQGLHAALAVTDFHYADGPQKLVDLAALRVDGLGLLPSAVAVDSVQIDKPYIRVAREKDGALDLAGIRIPAPSTQPAPQAVPVALAPPPTTTTKSSPGAPSPPAMVATLTKLRINDASLQWQDAAVTNPVDAMAHATVSLDNFVFGKDSPPTKLSIAAKVDQTIDNATIAGTVLAAPTKQQAQLAINATGIKAGVLASYLPPNIQSALKDGRAQLNLDAGIADNPAGGMSAHLIVDNLDYRDGADAPKPLFHLDAAHVLASRIDIPGNVVAVDEISVDGLETEAHLAPGGKMNLLGLTISPAAPPPAPPAPSADAAPATQPAPVAAATSAVAAPTTTTSLELNQMIAARKAKAPLITLEKLDIQLKRIAIVDDTHPDAVPIALRDIHLRNLNRIEMLGDDALNRPPAAIELTGGVDPLVQNFTVQTKVAPFASPATLDIVINADGIHGEGVTQAMPDLAKTLDGKPLADGKFDAHLEAQAKITRRGPAAYDLAEPFEISFLLNDVALKNGDAPQTLVGVQEVRADAIRVNPTTGDVIVHALEINKPIAYILRDTAGVHIAGLVLKEQAAPATQPSTATTEPVVASAAPPAPAQRPKSEIRIDKLLMSGIDVRIEDTTTTPPLIVPLTGLEVEARGLSNLAPYQDIPIQFNVLVNAGKVPIEGGKDQELFSEIAASGKLGLYPKPNGWVKTNVSSFELLGLYGPAKANKVTIGGGVFDSNVDLRFQNNGDIDTRSKFMFTDLKLSEPPDGPIRSFLKLPSPVDAVIVVLQDQDGTITAPLSVPVKDGKVSSGEIAGSAVGAFGSIVTTAIASSPLKVAGGVTSVLGIGKDKEKEHGAQLAADIHFPAGVADVSPSSKDIATVVDRLRRDSKLKVILKQELSQADVERAAQRANPSPEEAAALAVQLRQRKGDLLALRQTLAPQAQAMLTANSGSAGPATIDRLCAIDRDLAATENGLDAVYDLLRPGADRQADRRTRAAAIAIGDARLQTINDALLASNLSGIKDRIQMTHAQFNPAENAGQMGHVTLALQEVK